MREKVDEKKEERESGFVSHNSITKSLIFMSLVLRFLLTRECYWEVFFNFNLVGKGRLGLKKFFYLIFSDFLFSLSNS